jgi:N-acyl-D-amino-acid deacylase
MTTQQQGLTRRAALAGIGGLAAAAQVSGLPFAGTTAAQQPPQRPIDKAIPIRGKAGPGLEPVDEAMLRIMDRHGLPGAGFAAAKDGRLIFAKGYGWANYASGDTAGPDTLFGLASLSKSITAAAILLLIDQDKLGLDDKVLDYLKHIPPPAGTKMDPRFTAITVRHCLNHSGGWDRETSGDPTDWEPQFCRAFQVRPPLSPKQFTSFMQAMRVDFDPGTEQKYSNVGYIILGEIIAKVSGQAYDRFVIDKVLKPMGIKRAGLDALDGKYTAGEAVRYLAGAMLPLPPTELPLVAAAGGWSASVVDMARFLTNLDGSRGKSVLSEKARKLIIEPPPKPLKPRENGTYFGLGWDSVFVVDDTFGYFKDGSYHGIRTFMKRLPTGLNWVLCYNASMNMDPIDMRIASSCVHEIRQALEKIEKHPDVDLFKEFE